MGMPYNGNQNLNSGFQKMPDSSLKNKIISEFARQFNIAGPKLTLSGISSALHISKKTIYRYFSSKEDLYEEVLAATSAEIHAAQLAVKNDPSLSTKEKLLRILTIKTKAEALFDVSKMYQLQKFEPVFYGHLLAAYRIHWECFSELVEIGKQDGTLKPDTSAPFLVSLLTKGYEMCYEGDFLARNKMTYTEAVKKIAETVLAGIYAD
jgi:AcrR family transcriptional regulator